MSVDLILPVVGVCNLIANAAVWLYSAGSRRTNERFTQLEKTHKDDTEEVKDLIRQGDKDEERRRSDALRDLDARTGKAIDGLKADIKERFEDLKHTILASK